MENAINQLDFKFDNEKILEELLRKKQELHQEQERQFLITHRPGDTADHRWWYGSGSLWDAEERMPLASTSEFSQLDSCFAGTVVGETVNEVRHIAEKDFGKKIGRVRLLTLVPKTCYSLHKDPEEFRFHIPLRTSIKCFFVCSSIVSRMPNVGNLYIFKTNAYHTAVNASFEDRHHLVFDTYD